MPTQMPQDEPFLLNLVGPGHWGKRYLDIGAWHPIIGSNTYCLYLMDWRGEVYEPQRDMRWQFVERRPEDKFIEAAVADFSGRATFYGSGQLASLDPVAGRPHSQQKMIQVIDSATLAGSYSFASLDVEGGEAAVLKNINWDRLRVGVWMIECLDMHKNPTWPQWEKYLLDHGYGEGQHACRLNRFYVHKDYRDAGLSPS